MILDQIYAAYEWRKIPGTSKFKYCPLCGTPLIQQKVDQRNRPQCPGCGFIHYQNPYPAVSVLVIQNEEVLLGKRQGEPGKGKWALPSGYIEYEDDFLSTAIKEVREETGLNIELLSILNVQSAFLAPEYHFLGIYLLAQPAGGTLKAGDDLEDVKWFPLIDSLPEMAFSSDIDLIHAHIRGHIGGITIKK